MKKIILIILLFISIGLIGMIAITSSCIIYPFFLLFNPDYVLPRDKAFIDVAPISSWFWNIGLKLTHYFVKIMS